MHPIAFESANGGIGDIPVNRSRGLILSRWAMTWRERLSILIHGTIWLAVYGDSMPQILLSGNQAFEITPYPPRQPTNEKKSDEWTRLTPADAPVTFAKVARDDGFGWVLSPALNTTDTPTLQGGIRLSYDEAELFLRLVTRRADSRQEEPR